MKFQWKCFSNTKFDINIVYIMRVRYTIFLTLSDGSVELATSGSLTKYHSTTAAES